MTNKENANSLWENSLILEIEYISEFSESEVKGVEEGGGGG